MFLKWYCLLGKFYIKHEYGVLKGFSDNVKKRHHHISRCLLNNFKINSQGGCVYRRSKKTFKTEKCSIKKQAGLVYEQYTFVNKKTKKKDQFIEDFYALIEDKTGPIIKRQKLFIKNNFELNIVCHFVGLHIVRNPVFHEFVASTLSFVADRLFDKINKKTIKDVFVKNIFDIKKAELTNWLKFYDKNKTQKLLNISMICSNYLLQNITKSIFKYSISIFKIDSNNNNFFIISDNPVLFVDKKMMPRFVYSPPIIFDEDLMIILPITPKKCFVFSKIYKNGSAYSADPEFVKKVNALSIMSTPEYVYSDRKSCYLEEMYQGS